MLLEPQKKTQKKTNKPNFVTLFEKNASHIFIYSIDWIDIRKNTRLCKSRHITIRITAVNTFFRREKKYSALYMNPNSYNNM